MASTISEDLYHRHYAVGWGSSALYAMLHCHIRVAIRPSGDARVGNIERAASELEFGRSFASFGLGGCLQGTYSVRVMEGNLSEKMRRAAANDEFISTPIVQPQAAGMLRIPNNRLCHRVRWHSAGNMPAHRQS